MRAGTAKLRSDITLKIRDLETAVASNKFTSEQSLEACARSLQERIDTDRTLFGEVASKMDHAHGNAIKAVAEQMVSADSQLAQSVRAMEPRLQEAALSSLRVQLDQEELKTGVTQSLEAVVDAIDKVETDMSELSDLQHDSDINALLMSAAMNSTM
jgi:hypothetical protein